MPKPYRAHPKIEPGETNNPHITQIIHRYRPRSFLSSHPGPFCCSHHGTSHPRLHTGLTPTSAFPPLRRLPGCQQSRKARPRALEDARDPLQGERETSGTARACTARLLDHPSLTRAPCCSPPLSGRVAARNSAYCQRCARRVHRGRGRAHHGRRHQRRGLCELPTKERGVKWKPRASRTGSGVEARSIFFSLTEIWRGPNRRWLRSGEALWTKFFSSVGVSEAPGHLVRTF